MNATVEDLRPTIVPKSDQLNAEQLLGGPMVITVTDVRIGGGDDQPVSVHYANDSGRPFKPCKTMRKVLIFAWGPDGREWIGRSMTLYNDPQVRFGGAEVGGIRISHMTDIPKDVTVSLTATKGKKALHTIKRMAPPVVENPVNRINAADTVESLRAEFGFAYQATKDRQKRAELKAAYDARMTALTTGKPTLADFVERIDNATDKSVAESVVEEAREHLTETEHAELVQAFGIAWES